MANKLKTIDIKGKAYVLVSERVKDFNDTYKNGRISCDLLTPPESDLVMIKAFVYPDMANPMRFFTGHSQGIKGDGFINKTACLENVETSAIGRALGMMGIGIVEGIATADEVIKAQDATGKVPVKKKRDETMSDPAQPWRDVVMTALKFAGTCTEDKIELLKKRMKANEFTKEEADAVFDLLDERFPIDVITVKEDEIS